ncbi:hypothetical protein [Mesorhizobium sp. WSM3862]|uniref:DUF6881 domain-containing protein n=1 Tax=Mesorhizobium sp. WSM3862 TaxID=632858 RepID=UPI000BAEC13C|nr:hypothetical protein [Mesorhizobium sp. WSM3862]PBB97013.1 hypothetical protein CK224_16635 [Mesorhizobium sp. WSM3862]
MVKSYKNRLGVTYYLPDFGPPARWLMSVTPGGADLPTLYYFECDAQNLGRRAIHIYADGRMLLAYPGGLDGDHLPEGELPTVEEAEHDGLQTREIAKAEFDALWAALSRLEGTDELRAGG